MTNFTNAKFNKVELTFGSLNIQGGADRKVVNKNVLQLITSCDVFII